MAKKLIIRSALALLAILVILQLPFIYRRWQNGELAQKISEINAAAKQPTVDNLKEYKGIIHVHTSLGGHSHGHFDELIDASQGLDFVVLTEHYSPVFDTSALTLNGKYGSTLFVGGNEIDTADGDRFLIIPGSKDAAQFRQQKTDEVLARLHAEQKTALITYPEKFKTWQSDFDGIEILSLHTSAKRMNYFTAFFDLIWSYPAYPDLTVATHLTRPDANLQKYDEIAAQRNITLFPGTDAHSNIGFHLFGDETGKSLIGVKLDAYAKIFKIVRTHILIDSSTELDANSLNSAIKNGNLFIGLDSIGNTDGFRFSTVGDAPAKMGDTVDSGSPVVFTASAPQTARFVVLKNGEKFSEFANTDKIEFSSNGEGAYRVEVYLDQLGSPFDKMPWIMSNPIYIRKANENSSINIIETPGR